jgi:hypothetical protein
MTEEQKTFTVPSYLFNRVYLTITNGIARLTFCEIVPNTDMKASEPKVSVCTDLGNLEALYKLLGATMESIKSQQPGQPVFDKEKFN